MVRKLDEILADMRNMFGDNITDDVLRTFEDISDTFAEYAGAKEAYDRLDKEWRTRYIERFGASVQDDPKEEKTEELTERVYTLDDVFKEE